MASFSERVFPGISKIAHDLVFSNNTWFTDTSIKSFQSSFLLPNRRDLTSSSHLHLLVHGSKGGKIHPLLHSLVHDLRRYKNRSVSIDALTNKNLDNREIIDSPMFLVPLFLLPGNHVCSDVPSVLTRLQMNGNNIKLFPFLGSFIPWLSLLDDFISNHSPLEQPALIHHPVSSAISNDFSKSLESFFKIPVLSWSKWNKDIYNNFRNYQPIPYLLTPNRNVEINYNGVQLKSLLEIKFIYRGLVNILGNLP